jgi:hypothetical protein
MGGLEFEKQSLADGVRCSALAILKFGLPARLAACRLPHVATVPWQKQFSPGMVDCLPAPRPQYRTMMIQYLAWAVGGRLAEYGTARAGG